MKSTNKLSLMGAIMGVLLIAAFTGCASETFIKHTPVQVAPPRTNQVTITVTNEVPATVYVTNEVGVIKTNEIIVESFKQVTTPVVVPAVYYTNVSLTGMDTNIITAAGGAATLAGVPFGSLAGTALLTLMTMGAGFLNHLRMKKALNQKTDALGVATTAAQTLVENFETIRKTALQIPQYAAVDDKVMLAIQTAQHVAGVKDLVADLVEQHTETTAPVVKA